MNADILLNEALAIWEELTGVKCDQTSYHSFGEINIGRINEKLIESRKGDPTCVTTAMLLLDSVTDYTNNYTAKLSNIVDAHGEPSHQISKAVKIVKRINKILTNDIFTKPWENYVEAIRKCLPNNEATTKFLSDQFALTEIRVRAIRAVDGLEIRQFTHGKFEKNVPKYNPEVWRATTVHDLLSAVAAHHENGFTLGIIHEPRLDNSFFVIAVRNGGSIYTLSDEPDWVHPLQSEMTRRPDRRAEKREELFCFPYHLVDVLNKGDTTDVSTNLPVNCISHINELEPYQIAWLHIVFDLFTDKIFNNELNLETSYTGGMLVGQNKLTTTLQERGIIITDNKPIISNFSVKDIADNTGNAKVEYEGRNLTGHNQWLVDRYADKIPTNVTALKVLDDPNDKEGISTRTIGTIKELNYTKSYFARRKVAITVMDEAQKEFDEREEEIKTWYQNAVVNNAHNLNRYIEAGSLEAPSWEHSMGSFGEVKCVKNILKIENVNDCEEVKEFASTFTRYGGFKLYDYVVVGTESFSGGWRKRYRTLTGRRAKRIAVFVPTAAEALAILAGCDLPDVLRGWGGEPYVGNSILDNIDPVEWIIKNPWNKLRFRVAVLLAP